MCSVVNKEDLANTSTEGQGTETGAKRRRVRDAAPVIDVFAYLLEG